MPKRFGIFVDNASCERTMPLLRTKVTGGVMPRTAVLGQNGDTRNSTGWILTAHFAPVTFSRPIGEKHTNERFAGRDFSIVMPDAFREVPEVQDRSSGFRMVD